MLPAAHDVAMRVLLHAAQDDNHDHAGTHRVTRHKGLDSLSLRLIAMAAILAGGALGSVVPIYWARLYPLTGTPDSVPMRLLRAMGGGTIVALALVGAEPGWAVAGSGPGRCGLHARAAWRARTGGPTLCVQAHAMHPPAPSIHAWPRLTWLAAPTLSPPPFPPAQIHIIPEGLEQLDSLDLGYPLGGIPVAVGLLFIVFLDYAACAFVTHRRSQQDALNSVEPAALPPPENGDAEQALPAAAAGAKIASSMTGVTPLAHSHHHLPPVGVITGVRQYVVCYTMELGCVVGARGGGGLLAFPALFFRPQHRAAYVAGHGHPLHARWRATQAHSAPTLSERTHARAHTHTHTPKRAHTPTHAAIHVTWRRHTYTYCLRARSSTRSSLASPLASSPMISAC
jgi:hypothetical protein